MQHALEFAPYRSGMIIKSCGSTMSTIEGYFNVIPRIKSLSFDIKGKLKVTLWDGRIIIAPLQIHQPPGCIFQQSYSASQFVRMDIFYQIFFSHSLTEKIENFYFFHGIKRGFFNLQRYKPG